MTCLRALWSYMQWKEITRMIKNNNADINIRKIIGKKATFKGYISSVWTKDSFNRTWDTKNHNIRDSKNHKRWDKNKKSRVHHHQHISWEGAWEGVWESAWEATWEGPSLEAYQQWKRHK